MNIDYSEKIPNNVNLSNDRLQRALERWQPNTSTGGMILGLIREKNSKCI